MNVLYDLRTISLNSWPATLLVVLICLEVLSSPLWGIRSHRAFLAAMATAPADKSEAVRTRFLLRWAWQPWILTLAALLLVALAPGITFADLGLRLFSPADVGSVGMGFMAGAAIGLVGVMVAIAVSSQRKRRNSSTSVKPEIPYINPKLAPMLPSGRTDRLAWLALSATAGITEEIMYRGVLVLVVSALLPTLPPFLICAIAVLVFAVAHSYQGVAGIILTGILSIPLLALYLFTGSLLPGIVLHFIIDARSMFTKPSQPVRD